MMRSLGHAMRAAVSLAAVALTGSAARAQATLHAGIEIGGKGVKATVVKIDRESKTNPVSVPFAKTSNTTIANFDAGRFRPEAVTETVDAVASFVAAIEKEYTLTSGITVVGSSSVALAANKDDLIVAVEKRTGKKMTYITAENEAELSLTGLALQGERDDVLLIDIGSGNSKGGAFVGQKFVPFSVAQGTVTYTNRVKTEAAGASFAATAAAMADAAVLKPVADQITKAPGLGERKTVYATGGIVWAVATFAHPELSEQALVPLTPADVDRFLKSLADGEFPELNTDTVTSAAAKKAAVTDMKRIRDAFTPEQLTAGATILKTMFAAFKVDGKKVYFARNGLTAWIVAYVTPKDVVASGAAVVPPLPPPPPGTGTVTAPPLAPPLHPTHAAVPSYPAYVTTPSAVVVGTPVYHSAGVVYSPAPVVCCPPVGPTVTRTYAPPAPRRLFQRR